MNGLLMVIGATCTVWYLLCVISLTSQDQIICFGGSVIVEFSCSYSECLERKQSIILSEEGEFSSKARIISHGLCYSMVCVLWQLQVFIQLKPSSEGWILGMQRDGTSVST